MSKIPIHFFNEETTFKLQKLTVLRQWLNQTVISEKQNLTELNFIFCSDHYLLKINKQYLQHDTYTDIITFDNSEIKGEIQSDIFISIDRVRENAKVFQTTLANELHRVMIHGVLHLLGYKDKTKKDKEQMTAKENEYLNLLSF